MVDIEFDAYFEIGIVIRCGYIGKIELVNNEVLGNIVSAICGRNIVGSIGGEEYLLLLSIIGCSFGSISDDNISVTGGWKRKGEISLRISQS